MNKRKLEKLRKAADQRRLELAQSLAELDGRFEDVLAHQNNLEWIGDAVRTRPWLAVAGAAGIGVAVGVVRSTREGPRSDWVDRLLPLVLDMAARQAQVWVERQEHSSTTSTTPSTEIQTAQAAVAR